MSALIHSRRALLGATLAGGMGLLSFPTMAFGLASSKRFVLVILRGGMDGVGAAPAVGDPAYESARRELAIDRAKTLPLDSTFGLHPKLQNAYTAFKAGELTLIHAAASPYRERSHFDAQNVLETGAVRPFARPNGWLNAALAALPGEAAAGRRELGVALAQQAPLVLRGDATVATWSPSPLPDADTDTLRRLMNLYEQRDPALKTALDSAIAANAIAGASAMGDMKAGGRSIVPPAQAAAAFLTKPDGPAVAVLEMSGWDTHANAGGEQGLVAQQLALLDEGIGALKTGLGPAWKDSVVLIVTEFGRTIVPNGNRGFDHGTGGAAFLVGGAVAGRRVVADWPGLAPGQLNERRDLRTTTDIRSVMKGVMRDHLGIAPDALERSVFPDSAAARAIDGLIRTA